MSDFWPTDWGGISWAPFVFLGGLAAFMAVVWSVLAAPNRKPLVFVSAALKSLAIAAVLLAILEPLYLGERPEPGANLLLVVADNSRSLQLRDRQASFTRGETVQRLLDEKQLWRVRAGQDFDVRNYEFDSRLRSVDGFEGLNFEGSRTTLTATLRSIRDRYRDRPVAGVILLTDGNGDLRSDQDWSDTPPIFPVPIGADSPAKDLQLSRVTVNQTNFETAPVTLQTELTSTGYAGQPTVVEVLDESGQLVEQQEVPAPEDDEPLTLNFQFRPPEPGLQFYRIRTFAKAEGPPVGDANRSDEATLANNTRHLLVDRGGGPYRVLYVAGRPNWEYKFLRRALEGEQEIQLVGLIRIAKREPKFDFRSRSGETTNPLFRGFDNQEDEQAEQYDEPVLIRLGIEDPAELRDGFPTTTESLYRYDAIIIDDVESAFFTQDQMLGLQNYVNQRGGGLMMLAGQESFENGGYDRTPLGDLLPVYLSRYDGLPDDGQFRLRLTRDGMHPPWSFFRVRGAEVDERKRIDEMPPFVTLNRVSGVKPGAVVLATAGDGEGAVRPALTVQRFGAGRTGALLIGDLWRWSMRRGEGEEDDLTKAWRQTIRWLVSETPQGLEAKVEPHPSGDLLSRSLRITVRDDQFQPLDNANVKLTVETPGDQKIELDAVPDDSNPGVYLASYTARQGGAFRATVTATGPDGADLGRAEAGWTAEPDRIEFESLRPNRDALQRLADATNGEVIELADLHAFVQSLPERKIPLVETWVYSWWDLPYRKVLVFLLILAALSFDWGVRRYNGLA